MVRVEITFLCSNIFQLRAEIVSEVKPSDNEHHSDTDKDYDLGMEKK